MTREQKLALIVGFSLVLLVGVLISDHLSRARQAKIASVGSGESPATATLQPTNDPLKALNTALSSPVPESQPAPLASGPAAAPPKSPPSVEPTPPPTVIAQGSPRPAPASGDETALQRAVEGANGMIVLGKDGIRDIILPPASATTTVPAAASATLPVSNVPRSSPIPGLANPGKTLATNEPLKTHLIQKGETLFEIAAKYYGTGHVWRELAKFNGMTDKDGLVRVGSRLKIPAKEVLLGKPSAIEAAGRGTAPATPSEKIIPGRRQDVPIVKHEIKLATYTVRKGDTLGEISLKVLGSSKRWQELAEFNKLEDEDSIAAGTVLKVPPMRG